ncbi:hypothetical protein GCM10027290_49260 [Micromonospora sonneratiae]
MSDSPISLDRNMPETARQDVRDQSEDQLRLALRSATDLVRADYSGEPVEDVCRRLLTETRLALPSELAPDFTPDMDEFCRIAVAIVRGTPVALAPVPIGEKRTA